MAEIVIVENVEMKGWEKTMDKRLIREFLLPKQLEIYNEILKKKALAQYEYECLEIRVCPKCGKKVKLTTRGSSLPVTYDCVSCGFCKTIP